MSEDYEEIARSAVEMDTFSEDEAETYRTVSRKLDAGQADELSQDQLEQYQQLNDRIQEELDTQIGRDYTADHRAAEGIRQDSQPDYTRTEDRPADQYSEREREALSALDSLEDAAQKTDQDQYQDRIEDIRSSIEHGGLTNVDPGQYSALRTMADDLESAAAEAEEQAKEDVEQARHDFLDAKNVHGNPEQYEIKQRQYDREDDAAEFRRMQGRVQNAESNLEETINAARREEQSLGQRLRDRLGLG